MLRQFFEISKVTLSFENIIELMNMLVVLLDITSQFSLLHLGQLMVVFIDDKYVYSKI